MANFGYKFNWEHRRIAKLNDSKRGTKRKIVPQGSILQYTKKQKRLVYEMNSEEKGLVEKAHSFLKQMKEMNKRSGRSSLLRNELNKFTQISEKFPVKSKEREKHGKEFKGVLDKYAKENKLKYPVDKEQNSE